MTNTKSVWEEEKRKALERVLAGVEVVFPSFVSLREAGGGRFVFRADYPYF